MSEQTAPTEGAEETNEQGTDGASAFQAIESQDALDKIVQTRIARERAKFADYDDLKAKAEQFSQFEEQQKSEAQKAQDRAEAAEKRAAELELKSLRAEIAADKGVPVALLSGSSQEEIEAAAEALIKFKGDAGKGPVIPGQGKTPVKGPSSPADSFAGFFERQLSS